MKHPNIISMKYVNFDQDYIDDQGCRQKVVLIVLELAGGGELFDFLQYSGNFDEILARTYFGQLMSGIEYCHEIGVVHRDLKPENLLIADDLSLKIADFGYSKYFPICKPCVPSVAPWDTWLLKCVAAVPTMPSRLIFGGALVICFLLEV